MNRFFKEEIPNMSVGDGGYSSGGASLSQAGFDSKLWNYAVDQDFQTPDESGLNKWRFSNVYPVSRLSMKNIDNMVKSSNRFVKIMDERNRKQVMNNLQSDLSEESKSCKRGYYYCNTSKKCKKIPKGYHVMSSGYLMRDNEHQDEKETEGNKKNGNGGNGNGSNGNGSNGNGGAVSEEGLRDWFGKSKSKGGKGGWVNVVTGGTCASDKPGEGTPKCVSSEKRSSMSKAERLSAQRRKKAADPGQQQKSSAAKPTYVPTDKKKMKEEKLLSVSEAKDKKSKGSGTKDACYHKVKSRYSVWPSAYASGALVKCRKAGAANWGNKSEEFEMQEKTSHSGSVTFSSKAVPAKATDDSIKSSVSKALAKPGTSHSASSEKGKRENKVGVNYSMSYSSGGDKKKEKNKDKKDKKKPVLKKKDVGHGDPGKPNKPSSGGGGGRNRGGSGGGGGSRLRSGGGSETRPSASRTGSRTGGSTLSRGTTSSSGGRALMRNSFTDLRDILDEKCWKGYEKKGMKTMFGKRYPNCVKKTKKEDVNISDNIKLHVEGMGNVRYCPQCEKNETREECSYGPKNWDMNSSPVALGSKNTFNIASVTPSNEEYVQEKYERIQKMGRTYTMFFTFRGQYKSLQFFFPTSKRPSREDVLIQLRKIFPEAVLVNFFERDRIESEPLVTVEGVKTFGQFMPEGASWTKKSGQNSEGGLNEKGRKSYERENPGSDLKAPSKKVGNKRRASFCARMKGMRKRQKPSNNTGDDRLSKSLRAWNC